MPNMARRNKRDGVRLKPTAAANSTRKPHSVKDLLAQLTPALRRVSDQAARQDFWRAWLAAHLPAELLAHLSGIVERDDLLVVFAESAAWSARLRYALKDLETQLRASRPEIQQIAVRVRPKESSHSQ
jgi:hypothetical protein